MGVRLFKISGLNPKEKGANHVSNVCANMQTILVASVQWGGGEPGAESYWGLLILPAKIIECFPD